MTVKAFAPAKINLTLHVTGQRADGYHLLDSLVMFADIGDHVSATQAPKTVLTVSGPMAKGVPTDRQNLVVRAAETLGVTARITLEKHLPAAAGIGGGSSDAAATLRALTKLSNQPLPADQGLSLGADVPVCLAARAARMAGIGDKVTPLPGVPTVPALLVNPCVSVPTPTVFRALTQKTNPPMQVQFPVFETLRALINWLAAQRNDLQAPAIQAQPVIADLLEALSQLDGVALTRMSGSGATCFALFETLTQARAAQHQMTRTHPHWWSQACTLT